MMAPFHRFKKDRKDSKFSTVEKQKKQFKHFDPLISNFAFVSQRDDFVDKSLLIEAIFDEPALGMLVTAPPLTAKSTNIDMIKRFLEIPVGVDGVVIKKEDSLNYKIFKDLLIFQNKNFVDRHFASYPVIHASFKSIEGASFDKYIEGFKHALYNCFHQHEYLLKSSIWSGNKALDIATFLKFLDSESQLEIVEIEAGLSFLSKYLYKHFGNKKVFVLIDEYDAPMRNAMFFEKNVSVDQVRRLVCSIFSNTIHKNDYVEKAFFTGITYCGSVALAAGIFNIEKYMFLDKHKLVPYFGLTEDEVAKLLNKFQIDNSIQEKVKKDHTGYYNSYSSVDDAPSFVLWTVLHFLRSKST